MMNCPKIRALATEFFEGALGAVSRARFKFHILWCKDCRVHVHKMEQLIDATGKLPPEDEIPARFEDLVSRHSSSP